MAGECLKQAFIKNCHTIVLLKTTKIFLVMDIYGNTLFQEDEETCELSKSDSQLSLGSRKLFGKTSDCHHRRNGVQVKT